jgi:glycosyltransferase involved in cell wall biosynthesis
MITVLMTTYNDGNYLKRSISSVLNQDYKNYQLFIVDDGSEDETADVVRSFGDSRITYHKITHSGRSNALNYGLRNSAYEWVTLLDADDLIVPWKLSYLINYLNGDNNRIISSWAAIILNSRIISLAKYPVYEHKIKQMLLVHSFNNAVLYNRTFILSNNGYSPEFTTAEDHDLWLRLYSKAEYIILPQVLTFHSFRKDSLTNINFSHTKENIRKVYKRNIHLIDNHNLEAGEKTNVFFKRSYFYEEKRICFDKKYWFKNLLLLFIYFIPERLADKLRNLNIKGIIQYYCTYFNKESINLRNVLGGISLIGDNP